MGNNARPSLPGKWAGKNVKERMAPLLKQGYTQSEIAKMLGVTRAAVSSAIKRSKGPQRPVGRPRKGGGA